MVLGRCLFYNRERDLVSPNRDAPQHIRIVIVIGAGVVHYNCPEIRMLDIKATLSSASAVHLTQTGDLFCLCRSKKPEGYCSDSGG
jgi:hypothetical protein